MSSDFSEEIRVKILEIAREAILSAAEQRTLPPIELSSLPAELQKLGASFVTLTKNDALRGCIGTLEARYPLAEDIRQHAIAAALHDYRFPAIKSDEVEDIHIEVSVLTEPTRLEYDHPEDLLEILRPSEDGVIISDGKKRATFLPQVWERVPSPSLFLSMLCEKASLPPDTWREGNLLVQIYQVETIHESTSGNE